MLRGKILINLGPEHWLTISTWDDKHILVETSRETNPWKMCIPQQYVGQLSGVLESWCSFLTKHMDVLKEGTILTYSYDSPSREPSWSVRYVQLVLGPDEEEASLRFFEAEFRGPPKYEIQLEGGEVPAKTAAIASALDYCAKALS